MKKMRADNWISLVFMLGGLFLAVMGAIAFFNDWDM